MLFSLKKVFKQINEELLNYEYGNSPVELYEPFYYILSLGGKRLRPALTMLGFHLYSEDYQKLIKPAMAVELFHNFSLIHDDIMDKAPLRRGMATVHEKYNMPTAILSGDVMLVKAYELLASVDASILKTALDGFNKVASEVCEGQQMDMNFENREHVSLQEYIEMIRLKTSVLLGYSLQLGGLVAGASEEECQLLYKIGENAGIGFQIQDDLLDAYADAEKFGKQVGGDILANKKTYLLLKAVEKSDVAQKKELQKWLATDETEKGKVKAVLTIYDSLAIKEEAEVAMNQYFDQALADINKLKSDWGKTNALRGFIQELMKRDK